MVQYTISANLSGENFDPDLLLSRLDLPNGVRYKNKFNEMRPFGNDEERGKVAYGYGSLTVLDVDLLGHAAKDEVELEEFIAFLASFFDVLEEYGVEDSRLTLSVAYGQQCNFRLSRHLMLAIANLGQGLSICSYQDDSLAAAEKTSLPSVNHIAKELEVDEATFIHIIKPHMLNSKLYQLD